MQFREFLGSETELSIRFLWRYESVDVLIRIQSAYASFVHERTQQCSFSKRWHIRVGLNLSVFMLTKAVIGLTASFYRAMHFSAKRGIAIACRLSVRLSVCL